MALPLHFRLGAAALALALAAGQALPQSPPQRPPGKAPYAERTAVGLPIVTSDGKAIGKVVATGVDDDNQPVLVGEIERQLGLGLEAVAIPTDLFVRKEGRIELTITEDEVNARLAR
jgi:PRC-barrel domain